MRAVRGTGGTERLEALDPASHAGSTDTLERRLEHKTTKLRAREPSPTRAPLHGFRHREPRVSLRGL